MARLTKRQGMLAAAAVVLVALAGLHCNECNFSESYCRDGELYTCVPSGNGSEVFNTDTRSFQPTEPCGDAALCVEPAPSKAECVVSPTPDPACPTGVPDTAVCSGTTYVECKLGYRTRFVACASCDVSAYNHPCGGIVGDACGADSDCAPPLSCHAFTNADGGTSQACSQTCSGGAACLTGSGLAVGSDGPVPAGFPGLDPARVACVDGWCALR